MFLARRDRLPVYKNYGLANIFEIKVTIFVGKNDFGLE
jgi:hypothetical protein